MIQKDGHNWTVNGASTHARQFVAVFQVLCSLYGFTWVGYAQNSLEFFSRSPLIHAKNLVLHSKPFWSQLTLLQGCALDERSSDGIWRFRTFSFKCYVDHSYTLYSSENTDIRNWVHLFESPCIQNCDFSFVALSKCCAGRAVIGISVSHTAGRNVSNYITLSEGKP